MATGLSSGEQTNKQKNIFSIVNQISYCYFRGLQNNEGLKMWPLQTPGETHLKLLFKVSKVLETMGALTVSYSCVVRNCYAFVLKQI